MSYRCMYHRISHNTSFFISLIKFEGNMLYFCEYILVLFSMVRIKTKNGYFHKIFKNNRDKQQIKFLIFGTFSA